MRSMGTISAATFLMVLLAGCGSQDDGQQASATTAAGSPASSSAPAAAGSPAATSSADTAAPGTASPADAQPSASAAPTAVGTTITTGDSAYGPMLFDSANQAIYIWEVETSSTPQCYGDCARAWPPVLTDGAPVASGTANPGLLGTTPRNDGTTQVTYNGHPLYYYVDEAPGEVKCHNVATHGGLWWVVQPDGNRAP